MRTSPLVSIGLPVYNGARHIERAVKAVLAQTYEDLELIISDNASTDETYEICDQLARADDRIRLLANERNMGAAANFNAVFLQSAGRYFKWLGHDDFLEPTAIEVAVRTMRDRDDVSVVHWLERMTDENGSVIREYRPEQGFQIDGDTAGKRFRQMLFWRRHGFGGDPFFGLMRREALEATRLQGRGINPNYLLLQELSLTGKMITIPELLAIRIYNDERVTSTKMIRWLDPKGRVQLPHFRRAKEYYNVGLTFGEMALADRMLNAVYVTMYFLHPRELKGFIWDLTKGSFSPG